MQISLGLGIGIAVALALIVGVVTRFATISSLKNNADSKIGNAEAKAREIIWSSLLYQFGLAALYSKRGNGRRRLWKFVTSIKIIEKAS